MAFCSKCGAEIDEGAKFCPKCGEATGSNKADGSAKNENGKGNENEFEKIINTPDTTESFDRDDIAKNKGMAVLSYIWIHHPAFCRQGFKICTLPRQPGTCSLYR